MAVVRRLLVRICPSEQIAVVPLAGGNFHPERQSDGIEPTDNDHCRDADGIHPTRLAVRSAAQSSILRHGLIGEAGICAAG